MIIKRGQRIEGMGALCVNPISTGCTCEAGYVTNPNGQDDCILNNITQAVLANAIQGSSITAQITSNPSNVPNLNQNNVGIVTSWYQQYLNRAPDAGGLSYWVGMLNSGQSVASVLAQFQTADQTELAANNPPAPTVASSVPNVSLTPANLPQAVQQAQTSTSGGTIVTTPVAGNWFTDPNQSLFDGFPNWMLLAAVGGVGFFMFGGKE